MNCKYCNKTLPKRNKSYCNNECKQYGMRKEVLAKPDVYTSKWYEVCIKDYLPTAKNLKELKLWAKRATKRINSDEVNPYK